MGPPGTTDDYCAHLEPQERQNEGKNHVCRLKQAMGLEDVSCVASDYSALLSDTEGRGKTFFYKEFASKCPLYTTDEDEAAYVRDVLAPQLGLLKRLLEEGCPISKIFPEHGEHKSGNLTGIHSEMAEIVLRNISGLIIAATSED